MHKARLVLKKYFFLDLFDATQKVQLCPLTFARDRHHGLPVVGEAEAPGEPQLGDHGEGGVLLTAPGLATDTLLETNRAAALPLIVRCWNTEVVAVALVGQTRVLGRNRPLSEHDHCPEVNLVINQGLGIVSVGQINPDHFLVDRIEVVESSLHDGQGQRLVDSLLVNNRPPVSAVTVDHLNLG